MAPAPPTVPTGRLTAKQIRALQKLQREEEDLARIKQANEERYENECANLDILLPTPPERKRAVVIMDDNRPYLSRDSFVQVSADTSAGHNRPGGFGYITECNGVGGAAMYSVKYTPAYDGGGLIRNSLCQNLRHASRSMICRLTVLNELEKGYLWRQKKKMS